MSLNLALGLALTNAAIFFSCTASAVPAPSSLTVEPPTPVIRARYGLPDATDSTKILDWLIVNADLEPDRAVFYSGSGSDANSGETMARNFCEANEQEGYKYFYNIFDSDWQEAFGGAEPGETPAVAAALPRVQKQWVTMRSEKFRCLTMKMPNRQVTGPQSNTRL